jgi:hypothetical protein
MLAVNRLNADIPSPSLHLLGSDAGLRADISPLLTSFANDGHNEQTSRYRDKLLPDIPADDHTASSNMADVYTSLAPGQYAEPKAMAHAPAHSRSPVHQVVKLFTPSNSARATLVRPFNLPLCCADLCDKGRTCFKKPGHGEIQLCLYLYSCYLTNLQRILPNCYLSI